MAFLSTKTGQFTYFSLQLGESDWSGKYVLDFGGNIGNMLRDPNSTIEEERYWCIDVVKESVESGKAAFPKAHWVFYDRYCFFFNPHGISRLKLPEFLQSFDYVVAYSVFTNTSRTDMLDLVDQLRSRFTRRWRAGLYLHRSALRFVARSIRGQQPSLAARTRDLSGEREGKHARHRR